jgi:hypothetical protein
VGCTLAVGAAVYAGRLVRTDISRYAESDREKAPPVIPAEIPMNREDAAEKLTFPALFDPVDLPLLLEYRLPDTKEAAKRSMEQFFTIPAPGNYQILAFYGHPGSKRMGILGRYPKEELAVFLKDYARRYDEANGALGLVPAFYLIYGTCWPGGEIGYLKDSTVREYIEYAQSQGMLVFVDHQIGKYGVEAAVERLLPWLKYPNVHIALDPEWHTTAPMLEIGAVHAADLNRAQARISQYLQTEGIPGLKMLVVHQFNAKMITEREQVRADYPGVLLIHTADGFGSPSLKRGAYLYNAQAINMPLKGFKLFFKSDVEGAGYDEPLLTPEQVLGLNPQPILIIYQ